MLHTAPTKTPKFKTCKFVMHFPLVSNTFAFSCSNTIELPLVYFWRGKAQWALVRIHSACQNHPTTFSCILHLCLSRPLEWDNTMGIFCLTQRKRKFKHKFYSKCVSFPEVKVGLHFVLLRTLLGGKKNKNK